MWVKTILHCPVLSSRCKVWLGEIDYQAESYEFWTHTEWIGYQKYSVDEKRDPKRTTVSGA